MKTKQKKNSPVAVPSAYLQNYIHADISLKIILPAISWSSPHPISDSQLRALPHFHPCPIYLVVFKGVYFLKEWDISS